MPVGDQPVPTENSRPALPGESTPSGHSRPEPPGLARARAARLTAREREVLELLDAGMPARRIAARLAVQEATVRSYIRTLLRKLGCHSQVEAAALGRALGIVRGAHAEPAQETAADGAQRRARLPGSRVGGYRLLAEILAGCLAADCVGPDGPEKAGRAWGRYLADRPPLSPPLSAEASLRTLIALFAEIGFGTEVLDENGRPRVLLRRCPFRAVAKRHDGVVCTVHLGLVRGALAEFGGRLEVESLSPLAGSDVCTLDLRPADGAGRGACARSFEP